MRRQGPRRLARAAVCGGRVARAFPRTFKELTTDARPRAKRPRGDIDGNFLSNAVGRGRGCRGRVCHGQSSSRASKTSGLSRPTAFGVSKLARAKVITFRQSGPEGVNPTRPRSILVQRDQSCRCRLHDRHRPATHESTKIYVSELPRIRSCLSGSWDSTTQSLNTQEAPDKRLRGQATAGCSGRGKSAEQDAIACWQSVASSLNAGGVPAGCCQAWQSAGCGSRVGPAGPMVGQEGV